MIELKLGDRVRVKPSNRWHEDVGDSIGILVAIPNRNHGDYRVVFIYEDFLNDDDSYERLHDCETPLNYEVDISYFEHGEEEWGDEEIYILKEGYRGYNIEKGGLELAFRKKGNAGLFK